MGVLGNYMGTSNKSKIGIVLLMSLGLTTILSGCQGLMPLPDKERYQFINKVKDDMDYASAGKVIRETYDNNDGVFNASYFVVRLEGDNSFEILSERAKKVSDDTCHTSPSPATGDQTYCSVGQVDIKVYRENSETDKVRLSISDSFSGRTSD